ncbi:uncharacterized protein SCHCODRAFT_02671135 [Schizophyllum commune H4-8]|nr:uncharacterized protein SCHCODRAFT_02671135 [Schizophyllum commune H4-8]KAI5888554.1 hypothetical protein SCHCODRAFT_02671135 [Schizophyllum commune H4-8]
MHAEALEDCHRAWDFTCLPVHITQNEVLQTVHLLKAEDERVERPVHDVLQLARTDRGPSAPDEVEKQFGRIPLAMVVAVGKDGVQRRRCDMREEPVRIHEQPDATQVQVVDGCRPLLRPDDRLVGVHFDVTERRCVLGEQGGDHANENVVGDIQAQEREAEEVRQAKNESSLAANYARDLRITRSRTRDVAGAK